MKKNLIVSIMAAGNGTRMNPNNTPKVLQIVKNKPMIKHVIDKAIKLEPYKTILILGNEKDLIKEETLIYKGKLLLAYQNQQLGTAHAIKCMMSKFKKWRRLNCDGNILIMSADVPLVQYLTLLEMLSFHDKENNDLTVLGGYLDNPKGYGRLSIGAKSNLLKIVEDKYVDKFQKKLSLVNAGYYLIKSKVLEKYIYRIHRHLNLNQFYLTDIVELIKKDDGRVKYILAPTSKEILGVNTEDDLNKINKW